MLIRGFGGEEGLVSADPALKRQDEGDWSGMKLHRPFFQHIDQLI